MERFKSEEYYSLAELQARWSKAIANIKRNLIMSCMTEEKIFLKRWLKTNNVLVITKKDTTTGISFVEVTEWIKSA